MAVGAALPPAVADLFGGRRPALIAGPCVVESLAICLDIGAHAKALCEEAGLAYIFKASFDKANRTRGGAYRGDGAARGLEVLAAVRAALGVPVLTDIHLPEQAAPVAEVVDVLQVPAFLCRQTDLLVAAARTGRPTNVKKGQFLAPEDMRFVAEKFRGAAGATPGPLAVTERGTTFGYGDLVVDMRALYRMRAATGAPVIFDATHSVQAPSAGRGHSGGDRQMAPVLARAAIAAGADALFAEVHPAPDRALSDGPNSLDFPLLEGLVADARRLWAALGRLGEGARAA